VQKIKFSNVLKYAFSLALAGGLLWFVFKDIDLKTMWKTFQEVDFQWIILSGVFALVAHWSRAYRWKLMLQPIGYNPSAMRATIAVLFGYFANLFVPRAGEFARCGSLQKLENVPFEKSFGAVVAERLIDVLCLLILIFVNFLLEFNRLKNFFFDFFASKFNNPMLFLGGGIVVILSIILGFFLYKKNKEKITQLPLYQRVSKIIEGLWSGFTSVRNLKNPTAFVAHTLLIWTMYYFSSYVLLKALPETQSLSALAGLTILVMGSIGMAAPTQGGIGTYHFLVGNIVVLYGLTQQVGITLATFLHACQNFVFVPIFGAVAFVISLFLKKKEIIGTKIQSDKGTELQ
jgi:glycosyltransferase 2 family protein